MQRNVSVEEPDKKGLPTRYRGLLHANHVNGWGCASTPAENANKRLQIRCQNTLFRATPVSAAASRLVVPHQAWSSNDSNSSRAQEPAKQASHETDKTHLPGSEVPP